MKGGRLADAIERFKLSVEMYPQDGNVHDSLGEAFLAHGDRALAESSRTSSSPRQGSLSSCSAPRAADIWPGRA
ncbi:hypothetical protein BHS06_29065 [Myxococcus xanthus]|nr:hypothetical protein BHS06_29065 [Myxococcus xanthus]